MPRLSCCRLSSSSPVALAAEAGASFGVSPGFDPSASQHACELDLPFVPGCATATEAMRCLSAGHSLVKLFPAAILGGAQVAAAFLAPLRGHGLEIIATGGVSLASLATYLSVPGLVACGGSWIAPPEAIAAMDWAAIADRAAAAARIVRVLRRQLFD